VGFAWLLSCLGRGFRKPSAAGWCIDHCWHCAARHARVVFDRYGIKSRSGGANGRLPYFGPFPNRNNLAAILAMGAVLTIAAADDARRRATSHGRLFMLCMVPMFWAWWRTRRAGRGLLFRRLIAWMCFSSFSKRSAARVGISAALLLRWLRAFSYSGGTFWSGLIFRDPAVSLKSSSRFILCHRRPT